MRPFPKAQRLAILGAGVALTLIARDVLGQETARASRAQSDSLETWHLENAIAVSTSGVWSLDGELKGRAGEFYKVSGYLAYVASTATSNDNGENAVVSLYMQPMAGGTAHWLGARMHCTYREGKELNCLPVEGASVLLDYNFLLKSFPFRGQRVEIEITEPDDKEGDKRFTGRASPRGRLTLLPFERGRP